MRNTLVALIVVLSTFSVAVCAQDVDAILAEMQAVGRTAEASLQEGVELLYNEDRSLVYKENAPQATAAFSDGLKALLAHEASNPELYGIPQVTAGMVAFRARLYKERATSFLIQGSKNMYANDWLNALRTVEDLQPTIKAALADPAVEGEWRGHLIELALTAASIESDANGALGMHYLLIGENTKARPYLERALEMSPADDPAREGLELALELLE
jgi:hypothetical protein